jgi:D-beta-D-heptose 7-phosphate kinase/D-beta-D-heptose 1-phosphate adenosyltransferase
MKKKQNSIKALVVGDLMLDRFVRGNVKRISPEAPVPVVEVTECSYHLGGAANVISNLCSLGVEVSASGRVGNDTSGEMLEGLMEGLGVRRDALLRSSEISTSTKTRVVACQQQIVRFDEEDASPLGDAEAEMLIASLRDEIPKVDFVIVEDYGKGVLTPTVIDFLRGMAEQGTKVFVDPNPRNPLDWSGFTALKPNWEEACSALGLPEVLRLHDDAPILEQVNGVVAALLKKWKPKHLLITLSEHGMVYGAAGQETVHFPAVAHEIFDVSGAGDTAIAVFSMALAMGASGPEATRVANDASSLVVGKPGTATISQEEFQKIRTSNKQ